MSSHVYILNHVSGLQQNNYRYDKIIKSLGDKLQGGQKFMRLWRIYVAFG